MKVGFFFVEYLRNIGWFKFDVGLNFRFWRKFFRGKS